MANWLTEAIAKETAYDKGYEAGKIAASESIFEEIEKLLDKHFTKANFTDGTCTFLYDRGLEVDIADLKKKYGVK